MPNYHVEIFGRSRPGMADLVRVHGISVLPQTLREAAGGYRIAAIADQGGLDRLATAGYRVDRHEDVDAEPGAHAEGAAVAAGRTYLSVEEVERATADTAGNPGNAAFTELIALPHPTWEGRTPHAIRIHQGTAATAALYFLGGVHAREWGSPDILINLVRQLTDGYRTGAGIVQGGYSCSAADVKKIVETLDVVVFPQANPDGRHHSLTRDAMWRKNRRPAAADDPACPGGGGNGPGVDVNRNYDFLWDYPHKFSGQAAVVTSTDPCDATFRGPASASEPETQNVVWLMDRFPQLGYFIDVHSFGEDILYNWGDDDNQTTDPAMTFTNPAFDGQRGVLDAAPGGDPQGYREYIPAADRETLITLGTVMHDAIQAAHGRSYTVKPAVDLYPTSGTSDDYGYSRTYTDPAHGKVFGYTIEWGPQRASIPKAFTPTTPTWCPSSKRSPRRCWLSASPPPNAGPPELNGSAVPSGRRVRTRTAPIRQDPSTRTPIAGLT